VDGKRRKLNTALPPMVWAAAGPLVRHSMQHIDKRRITRKKAKGNILLNPSNVRAKH
jgi:hypothetical protein